MAKYYIYEHTLFKEYGYAAGVKYDEEWRKIKEVDTLEEAKDECIGLADGHHYTGTRDIHPGGIVGFKFEHECLGGSYINVNPLPYVELGYYIFDTDIGEEHDTFFKK